MDERNEQYPWRYLNKLFPIDVLDLRIGLIFEVPTNPPGYMPDG
jgi:hypothetical protein